MKRFVTIHDDTDTCIDVDEIKVIVGTDEGCVLIDLEGHQWKSPLTAGEVRARIDAVTRGSLN